MLARSIIGDMTSKLTKARQQTAVGEGLAIGCIALGHTELSANKMAVEFAFQRAWRDWPQARMFPQIRAGLDRNDIYYQIMGRSGNRQGPRLAYWNVGRTLRPQLSEGSDMEDAEDLIEKFYELPMSAWANLARAFCDDLVRPGMPPSE